MEPASDPNKRDYSTFVRIEGKTPPSKEQRMGALNGETLQDFLELLAKQDPFPETPSIAESRVSKFFDNPQSDAILRFHQELPLFAPLMVKRYVQWATRAAESLTRLKIQPTGPSSIEHAFNFLPLMRLRHVEVTLPSTNNQAYLDFFKVLQNNIIEMLSITIPEEDYKLSDPLYTLIQELIHKYPKLQRLDITTPNCLLEDPGWCEIPNALMKELEKGKDSLIITYKHERDGDYTFEIWELCNEESLSIWKELKANIVETEEEEEARDNPGNFAPFLARYGVNVPAEKISKTAFLLELCFYQEKTKSWTVTEDDGIDELEVPSYHFTNDELATVDFALTPKPECRRGIAKLYIRIND